MAQSFTVFELIIVGAMGLAIVLLLIILILLAARRPIRTGDLPNALSESWIKLGLSEKMGNLEADAKSMLEAHGSVEKMLRAPQQRGAFGEMSLELILKEHLPPSIFGIREQAVGGKTPDALVRTNEGIICIDSKFPLENYRRMVDADSELERSRLLKTFLADTKKHLEKVKEDYVCPENGTQDFALVFIPSEAVYYSLATDGYQLLNEYVHQGVQVVSPLLLSHKMEILQLGFKTARLNDSAKEVLLALHEIGSRFRKIDNEWRTFYDKHLKNVQQKSHDINKHYSELSDAFDRLSKVNVEEEKSE